MARRPPRRAQIPAPTAEELRAERRARKARAVEEPLDVRLREDLPFPSLEVSNPVHRTRYRVLLPSYPDRFGATCTCTDFARRGLGTCKHLEAAWIWLEANPIPAARRRRRRKIGPTASRIWLQLDRRNAALGVGRTPSARELHHAGDPLLE